jgi:hypothetical protein
MTGRDLRVVIGEAESSRSGLLRFILEGEGFSVAAEADTVADLSDAIAEHHPDVVVLDDALGVAGVAISRSIAPAAKVVVVWPAAVQAVGADARVEPITILRELGPTVHRVAGGIVDADVTETFRRPDWIGKVRKDPAKLREILANGRPTPPGPSVTELQAANRRNHADIAQVAAAAALSARPRVDPSPPGEGDDDDDDRKVGAIALGAAAVAGAIVFSAAIGSGTTAVHVAGEAPGDEITASGTAPIGQIDLGNPSLHVGQHTTHRDHANHPTNPTHGSDVSSSVETTGAGTPGTGGGTPGGGGGGNGGGGGGGNGGGGGGNGGGGGDGGGLVAPGRSGEHNPHGGPPGLNKGSDANRPGQGHAGDHAHGPSSGARVNTLVHHHKA